MLIIHCNFAKKISSLPSLESRAIFSFSDSFSFRFIVYFIYLHFFFEFILNFGSNFLLPRTERSEMLICCNFQVAYNASSFFRCISENQIYPHVGIFISIFESSIAESQPISNGIDYYYSIKLSFCLPAGNVC